MPVSSCSARTAWPDTSGAPVAEPISDDYLTHLRTVAAVAMEQHSPFCYMSASTVDSIAAELIRLRAELAAQASHLGESRG